MTDSSGFGENALLTYTNYKTRKNGLINALKLVSKNKKLPERKNKYHLPRCLGEVDVLKSR